MSNPVTQVAALTPTVTGLRDTYAAVEDRHRSNPALGTEANARRTTVHTLAARCRRYAERLEQTQADLLAATIQQTRPATHSTDPEDDQ